MNDFSVIGFRRTWLRHPENLLLFPIDILEKGMSASHEAKVAVIAELAVRVFLSNDRESEAAQLLKKHLTNHEIDELLALFPGPDFPLHSLDGNLWSASSDFSKCCETAVRKRLKRLFMSDGLIPVYLDDGSERAFLIPFSFDASRNSPCVLDLNDREVPEWTDYAVRLGIQNAVVLHFFQDQSLPLTGNSLMLPLQMAWWRRNGQLPAYNVFRLVATGGFDSELRLAPVATTAKAKVVIGQLHEAHFIIPESDLQNPHGLGGKNHLIHYLPSGMGRNTMLEKIRATAERLDKLDVQYALNRMDALSSQVRLYNYANWATLAERLRNADVFDRRRNPDAYLNYSMLLSETYRHAGQNAAAEKYNARARNFARQQGDKYTRLLLRLEIETLVDQTDNGDISEAIKHSGLLLESLEKLNDKDLWMRFHGTVAQALMYGTLLGLDGFSEKRAKSHLDKAIALAYDIGDDSEIAHDLNYMHLYHAIFAPGSDDEQISYEDAKKQHALLVKKAQTDDERDNALRNLFFLKRSQAFAWYRKGLMDNRAPTYVIDNDFARLLHLNQGAEDWIRCCVAKYLGALEVANGRMSSAKDYFKKATTSIAPELHPGIKSVIRLAALAEAFRCLGDKEYQQEALAMLDHSPSLLKFPKVTDFKEFLMNNGPLPSLSFWY